MMKKMVLSRMFLSFIILGIILVVVGVAGYSYWRTQDQRDVTHDIRVGEEAQFQRDVQRIFNEEKAQRSSSADHQE